MRTPNLSTILAVSVTAAAFLFVTPAARAQSAPPGGGGGYGYRQPGYRAAPAGPPGYFFRQGLTYGGGVGIGGMNTDSGIFQCPNCNYNPAAIGLDGHIGAMLDPRTAILLEGWAQGQTLDINGNAIGTQSMLMVAVQRWLAPQFWIKGGIGLTSMAIDYADGYQSHPQTGWGVLAAGGYEILSAPRFAIDLELRIGLSSYSVVNDRASVGMVGIGVNWFGIAAVVAAVVQ